MNAAISSLDASPKAESLDCLSEAPKPGGVLQSVFFARGGGPIFNVYSSGDWSNRYLFRTAALFGRDDFAKGAGATEIPPAEGEDPKDVAIDEFGNPRPNQKKAVDRGIWNVDASEIIDSHTDIYKGRVSHLIVELLKLAYNARRRPGQ